MKHRKLRVAWSVAWGIVAVLLLSICVRSYWRYDLFLIRLSSTTDARFVSSRGKIAFCVSQPDPDENLFRVRREHLWVDPNEGHWLSGPVLSGFGKQIQMDNFEADKTPNVTRLPEGPIYVLRDWMVLGLSAILGVSPLVPWRSFRFSLRTLLIATTAFALVLGLFVWLR